MANKFGGRVPIDSLSGVQPSRRVRFTPRPVNTNQSGNTGRPHTAPQNATEANTKPAPNPNNKGKDPKVVSFELKLPPIKKPNLPKLPKFSRLSYKPSRRAALAAGILGVAGLVALGVYSLNKSSGTLGTSTEIKQTAPTFETLTPPEAEVKEQPVSFDEEKGVASFAHKIGGVNVTVSQQPMPDKLKANPAQEVENIAKSLKATKVITAGEVKAFSGTSSEDGTQTVLFTKNGLLIFIRAQQPLSNDALAKYIVDLN